MKAYCDFRGDFDKDYVEVRREGANTRLCFDFETIKVKGMDGMNGPANKQNRFEIIDIVGTMNYATIVSAIVRSRFDDNAIQAILSNYLGVEGNGPTVLSVDGVKKEEYEQEYADFQQWRSHAKDVAKKVLELI